ncbi:MAG: alanyl-tRNA editing protein [Candidatus Aenigmarchaeota archaeon]|nr:alanyl-tRNA editing protein [Candidatus Aenigmarchaeota archaeon]
MKNLYLIDSYLKEWTTKVESADGRFLTLRESAFYPAGGGQPCDKGVIACSGKAYRVSDVSKKNGIQLDEEGLHAGDSVQCALDWERRYMLMRMHTAAHILIAVMYRDGKVLVTGNQLDAEKSRIDFSLEEMDRQKIDECFGKANDIAKWNLPVTFAFMEREDAEKIPHLQKLAAGLPNIDELRILSIGEGSEMVDEQADGGTHVRSTAEIGEIKLLSVENKGRSNRRVYYKVE